jgi:hypothetical protein
MRLGGLEQLDSPNAYKRLKYLSFLSIISLPFVRMRYSFVVSVLLSALPVLVQAQLSGSVGPTTSTASKAAKKVCNVLSYGAKADKSTDLGPALYSAWNACKTGGIGNPP